MSSTDETDELRLAGAAERAIVRPRPPRRIRPDDVITASSGCVHIHGLPLPAALLQAIHEGRWRCPTGSILRRVFRDPPVRASFYDLEAMDVQNRSWREQKDPAFLGHPDDKTPPGDIDPARSLLLGALGPDMPFALDYRASSPGPRVLYLHTEGDRWITVARDVEHLLAALRLAGPRGSQ